MVPEAVAKSARLATKKLLVMNDDELSEEEEKISNESGFYDTDPRELACEANKQMLGEENHVALRVITATSAYESDDGFLEPRCDS